MIIFSRDIPIIQKGLLQAGKMKLSFLFFTILFSTAMKAVELSPEVEAERYLLEAERLLHEKSYNEASEWISKASTQSIKQPDKYYFILGTIKAKSGNTDEALGNLALYLNMAGENGEYYQQALDTMIKIKGTPAAGQTQLQQRHAYELSPAQPNTFVKQMKSKIISSNQLKHLQGYLNSLLKVNAVLNKTSTEAIPEMFYRVYFNDEGRLSVSRNKRDRFGLQSNIDSLSVYGINTRLEYDCSWREQRCWVTYPQNNEGKQGRWLEISYAPHAIGELADGMGLLIRELQK